MDQDVMQMWLEAFREAWAAGRKFVLINPVNGDRTWIE